MDPKNPLDKHLELYENKMPAGLKDAATETADQMDLARLVAVAVFKDDATPELAVQMYDRMLARLASHPA